MSKPSYYSLRFLMGAAVRDLIFLTQLDKFSSVMSSFYFMSSLLYSACFLFFKYEFSSDFKGSAR